MITAGVNSSLIDQIVVDTGSLEVTCSPDLTYSADPGQCSKAGVAWAFRCDRMQCKHGDLPHNGVVVTTPATFPVGTNPALCVITDNQVARSTVDSRLR